MLPINGRRRVLRIAAVAIAIASAQLAWTGQAHAHGTCTGTASAPQASGGSVRGTYTFTCTSQHETNQACAYLYHRPIVGGVATLRAIACNETHNTTVASATAVAACEPGWWRTVGDGRAFNSSGVLVHINAAASPEVLILVCI